MQQVFKSCRLFVIGICSLVVVAWIAQAAQDELRLRSGTVLRGRVIEVDRNMVVFRTEEGVREFKRSEVAAIFFEREAETSADLWGTPPPEFTAKPPHKVIRVIVCRRITQNRMTEQGKFEPEVAKISGDGSKIAFWTRNGGLYTINPDGAGRTLLWERDNTERTRVEWPKFELSPDGKVIYWQGVHPIYRIKSDGTGEKILVREGGEYESFRLREGGKRIFFSQRGGIFSIDTEGRGDYKEIITPRKLAQLWEVPEERTLLGRFDVSEDGTRVAFVVGGNPKFKAMQLMTINADGTGLRRIVETEFDPYALTMTPDGNQVLFWKYAERAYAVNWDGSGLRELPIPAWDPNGSGFQHLNRFSANGEWFSYNGNEAGGFGQIARLDGSGRFEPQNCGPWHYYDNALFHGMYSPVYTADLRRFVCISQYWRGFRPRQLVVGDINPRMIEGLPVLSDIEFPGVLSTNPQVPQYRGMLKVRVIKGASDIERVQFALQPMCQRLRSDPNRWQSDEGWRGLQGDHILRDDGKGGDEVAGDGIYTSDNLSPDPYDFKPPVGRHLLRIVVHDENNAVIVDVDGVEIK